METSDALGIFAALAQQMRLDTLRWLIAAEPQGLTAGDLATLLEARANTLSANLAILTQAGLVRSQREGRQIRYFARLETVQALTLFLMRDCCGGNAAICGPVGALTATAPRDTPFNVLFLCTGNSARSLMAEAVLNADPSGRFRGFSAGSQPAGQPHPRAIQLLDRLGHDTRALRPKSWAEFAAPDATQMDAVFSLCDSAAAESRPVWPGQPVTAHWGVPDPAAATGSDAEIGAAFTLAHRMLATRIGLLTALPLATLDRISLQSQLDTIGKIDA